MVQTQTKRVGTVEEYAKLMGCFCGNIEAIEASVADCEVSNLEQLKSYLYGIGGHYKSMGEGYSFIDLYITGHSNGLSCSHATLMNIIFACDCKTLCNRLTITIPAEELLHTKHAKCLVAATLKELSSLQFKTMSLQIKFV